MMQHQDTVLAELTHALVEGFAPERIVLFGSRARGDHHPESDYDLLVVIDAQCPPSEDVVRRAAQEVHSHVEVLVDSGERYERRRTDVGTLEYAADHEGRLLYTRAGAPDLRRVREPPEGPPDSLQEWIARGRSDFTAMEALLHTAPDVRDGIVFHAHQGVEKMLKAVLVARRVPPPRTHDLTELALRLPAALRDDASLAEACRGLQSLWPNSRYPGVAVPTEVQMNQAVAWARTAREIAGAVVAV